MAILAPAFLLLRYLAVKPVVTLLQILVTLFKPIWLPLKLLLLPFLNLAQLIFAARNLPAALFAKIEVRSVFSDVQRILHCGLRPVATGAVQIGPFWQASIAAWQADCIFVRAGDSNLHSSVLFRLHQSGWEWCMHKLDVP